MMKLLRPGDPCPCCGRVLPYDLPRNVLEELSRIADYKARMDAGLGRGLKLKGEGGNAE